MTKLQNILLFFLVPVLFVSCKKNTQSSYTNPSTTNPDTFPRLPTTITYGIKNSSPTALFITGIGQANLNCPITEVGFCWNEFIDTPTIAGNKFVCNTVSDTFSGLITGLKPETYYYVRAYAKNRIGITYGNSMLCYTSITLSFNPAIKYDTLKDIDGNTYLTVKIGTQTWMAQDLKVRHYRNGDPIVSNASGKGDVYTETPFYYEPYYGYGYNYFAVLDPRSVAPQGWHIPTENEWDILANYLAGSTQVANALKEPGPYHWGNPNNGNNQSGFTAIGTGNFINGKQNSGLGTLIGWWSSTKVNSQWFTSIEIQYNSTSIEKWIADSTFGLYIRCVKD